MRRGRAGLARWGLAAGLALLGTGLGQPLNFSLTPTSFLIESGKTLSGQTRFTNTSTRTAVFTVTAYGWNRVEGEDQLTPTRDVLVTPSRFVLQPGASQVVRVAVQRRPGQDEMTYRVLLRQVEPERGEVPPGEDARGQIDALLELSLPVYVVPPTAAARIGYQVQKSADGKDLTLVFSNSGNRSYVLKGLKVTAGSDQNRAVPNLPQSFLIFRGNSYRVPLAGFGAESTLNFSFLTAEGKVVSEKVQVR
ncbi:hypothetical protein Dcar01_01436 [Deinococcus carri]|uniref:Pili assembly chaperone N-terminal domain-containing protein n=1 Tax=Deinococcus carri TaxID=1211323 RepID=A0ABP9W5R1_9DEIO